MVQRLRACVFACLLGFALEPPGSVAAQDGVEALARAGDEAFRAGQYEQALAKFQAALQQSQTPEILFRLGQTYEKLGRPVEALDHFERFLATGTGSDARMQKEARAQAQALVGKVGEVTVRAKDGTAVSVDGNEVGKTPLAPFRVAAGIREVALGGYEETVRVAGGGRVTVGPPPEAGETAAPMLAVTPATAPEPALTGGGGPVDATTEPESDSLTSKWWFWTAVGVVAVGAAAGVLLATGGEDPAEALSTSDGSLAPVNAEW